MTETRTSEREERWTGESLYHARCGSSTTDEARYWHSMNPAEKRDWERLAADLNRPAALLTEALDALETAGRQLNAMGFGRIALGKARSIRAKLSDTKEAG